ncbi:MAG: hypothetical protein FD124_3859, partial [Alphaproteobacteria bacterium]
MHAHLMPRGLVGAWAIALVACASATQREGVASTAGVAATPVTVAPAVAPASVAPASKSAIDREPILTVTDPAALRVVEAAGGDFGVLVVGLAAPGASNAALAQQRAYRSIADWIDADVREVARSDPRAGIGIRGH